MILNVVFDTDFTESLALLIILDRRQDIQDGGVNPALINLENKELTSGDIRLELLLPCNRRRCQSSSLP